ncbi:MAG: hypothetical protein ACK559_15115 [bacterium]
MLSLGAALTYLLLMILTQSRKPSKEDQMSSSPHGSGSSQAPYSD